MYLKEQKMLHDQQPIEVPKLQAVLHQAIQF